MTDDLVERLRSAASMWGSAEFYDVCGDALCTEAADALKAERTKVQRLEADARRYRWLREWVYKDEGYLHCRGPNVDHLAFGDMREALDDAIDAAIDTTPTNEQSPKS